MSISTSARFGMFVVPGWPGVVASLILPLKQVADSREAKEADEMNLQALIGVDLPIIQAPMAGVQGSALAVAVSNAGGLGSLPCALLTADGLRKELTAIRAQTNRPYNVNFFCHTPPVQDAQQEAAWRDRLALYYKEF